MSHSLRRTLRRRVTCALALGALLVTVLDGVAPVGVASAEGRSTTAPGPARARFVALGDSYSSGEGLYLYRGGTDTSGDRCHRSPLAYGPLLSYVDRHYRPFAFVACSGAATADLYAPNHLYPTEAPQLAALSTATRTVTLTLGGNDVGFREALGACVRPRVGSTTACSADPRLTGAVAVRTGALAGATTVPGITSMPAVLASITAAAPNATVFVGGYPELFGDDAARYAVDATVPGGRSCTLLATGVPAADLVLAYPDAQYLNAATRRLNQVLAGAVAQARFAGARVEFVPATPFEGHGLCDVGRPWINPVVPAADGVNPRPESLHPNLRGSIAYAEAFYAAWTAGRALPSGVHDRARAVSSAAPAAR